MVVAGLMFFPILVSLIYVEPLRYLLSFLITAVLMVGIGFSFYRNRLNSRMLFANVVYLLVAPSLIVVSAFCSFPFVVSGHIPSFVDAFYGAFSGFTTTGSSILADVEALPPSLL